MALAQGYEMARHRLALFFFFFFFLVKSLAILGHEFTK